MKRVILMGAALAMVLAGCEMSAEMKVNPDGSGTFGFVVGLHESLVAAIPASEDPFADLRNEFDGSPVPFTFEEFSERGLRGVRATVPFTSIEDLERTLNAIADSQGQAGGAFGDDFVLVRDGDGWSFSATGTAPDTGLNAPPSDTGLLEDPFAGENPFGDLAGLIDISFKVTLPGVALDHNATETTTEGGSTTFVWKLDPSNLEPVSMRARSSGGGAGGFPILPVGVGVALLGLGVIVAAKLRRPPQPPVPVFESYGDAVPPRQDEMTG